jgi:hypothetical protein
MDNARRAPCPKGRHAFLRVKYAWCQHDIGWKPKEGSVPSETTYGMCPACFAEMVRKLRR